MKDYNTNYFNISLVVYPPDLKLKSRNYLMITQEKEKEISRLTNDSALRLYKFYIDRRGWKHFNPINYETIGDALGWTKSKTEKTKGLLVKAGLLLIIKDKLKDGSYLYRVLLGEDAVKHYNSTGQFPELAGVINEK